MDINSRFHPGNACMQFSTIDRFLLSFFLSTLLSSLPFSLSFYEDVRSFRTVPYCTVPYCTVRYCMYKVPSHHPLS